MSQIRILHLEDNPYDAEIIARTMEAEGLEFELEHVATREKYMRALVEQRFDLVLSDYNLPNFNGISALQLLRGTSPATPFIFVTGSLGEEKAIDTLRNGAIDYVLKHHLDRLVPAIQRALQEVAERRARRIAEERILEHAELLDLATDAIMTCDLEGVVHFWNQGAERLYGWNKSQVAGRRLSELVSQEAASLQAFKKIALERGTWNDEVPQKTRDGRKITVSSRWTVLQRDPQKPSSILIINTDITEKKELQDQILRAQRLESIGALAGGIAHDLNNVLAPIVMGIQLLKSNATQEEDQTLLEILATSAERGASMVKQILSFAQGSAEERRMVQLNHLVSDIVAIAKTTFPPSIQVRKIQEPDLWHTKIDTTQIYQVLMNLCVNARDAMAQGGVLQISTKNVVLQEGAIQPGPYVMVSVEDSGSGISPEILQRIFDPFFTTKEPGKGTGLGLSTSRGIITSHGGHLSVESEVGRGSLFKILLSAIVEEPQVRLCTKDLKSYKGHGEWILVVDDEQTIRGITKETLESYGYQVITACDGTEALACYARHSDKIQAVITDMAMPFLDGTATIRALRNMNKNLKIIAVSGTVDLGKSVGLEELRPNSYLQKPFTTQALLAELHQVLGPAAQKESAG